jgi:transcriptional regulator with XRE-family HTH domain
VEAARVNETLCRALLQARLTEEDVAAHLHVDPKTVRRWLEGRVPYLRHRWALAALLDADEVDLWPQLRPTRQRPEEVKAIYPHRDAVPAEDWLDLFQSARQVIDVLDHIESFLVGCPAILATLAERVHAGVKARICLAVPDRSRADWTADIARLHALTSCVAAASAGHGTLPVSHRLEVRLHGGYLYNVIFRADAQLLVAHHAHLIPGQESPMLRFDAAADGELVTTYLEEFDRIWIGAEQSC